MFREGVDVLTRKADESGNQDIQTFAAYIRRYWLPLGNVVSNFGVPFKTNNTCELFHRNAHRVLHEHPEFFPFLSKFNKLIFTKTFLVHKFLSQLIGT